MVVVCIAVVWIGMVTGTVLMGLTAKEQLRWYVWYALAVSVAATAEMLLNEELKRLDPDGLLPETDARVRVRKAARDRRYEMECALKDFDAQDWK